MIVWDLFGGGQNSVWKALQETTLEDSIYTFDITPKQHENQHYIDLAKEPQELIEWFKQFPKPNLITASPLCQSFSIILSMRGGGTAGWKINGDGSISLRTKEDFELNKHGFTKNIKYEKANFIAKLGERCLLNTIRLIEYFQPKYWYIENPGTSLMWRYTKHNLGLKNVFYNFARYGAYGYPINKYTCFLSNVELDLKKDYLKGTYDNLEANCFRAKKMELMSGKRIYKKPTTLTTLQIQEGNPSSKIPEELIWEIIQQWMKNWIGE